jgi:hypothetical protein
MWCIFISIARLWIFEHRMEQYSGINSTCFGLPAMRTAFHRGDGHRGRVSAARQPQRPHKAASFRLKN